MSDLSIAKRGVETITDADVGTSKDLALVAPVKPGSSWLKVTLRDRRRNLLRQRVAIAITDADVGGTKDSAAFNAVDMEASQIVTQIREKRTDDHRGATVDFLSATVVRATFNPPAAGDTINLDVQILEHKPRRGVTIRLLDANTLRIEWDLQLVAGESITISWELVDLDEIADMLLEANFRLQRTLGELGGNQIQDQIVRDDVGNVVEYRSRTFTTKTLAEAATPDIPDGEELEEGEMSRRKVTIDIDIRKNDRKFLISVLDGVMDTPGLTVDEEA
jgi:hypothetical protein